MPTTTRSGISNGGGPIYVELSHARISLPAAAIRWHSSVERGAEEDASDSIPALCVDRYRLTALDRWSLPAPDAGRLPAQV